MVGDLEYPHHQACLPRQGKFHPDTGRSLQSCIFIVQESGEGIVRLPEHPLIQDSLNDDEVYVKRRINTTLPKKNRTPWKRQSHNEGLNYTLTNKKGKKLTQKRKRQH